MENLLFTLLLVLTPIFIYVFMTTDNSIDYSGVIEELEKDIDREE